jgi:hypothetical protein
MKLAPALRFGRLQFACWRRNFLRPCPPPIVGLDSFPDAYCGVCHTLKYSLSGHSFDFWDKIWDKRFGRLEPCWIQQLKKGW